MDRLRVFLFFFIKDGVIPSTLIVSILLVLVIACEPQPMTNFPILPVLFLSGILSIYPLYQATRHAFSLRRNWQQYYMPAGYGVLHLEVDKERFVQQWPHLLATLRQLKYDVEKEDRITLRVWCGGHFLRVGLKPKHNIIHISIRNVAGSNAIHLWNIVADYGVKMKLMQVIEDIMDQKRGI